MNVKITNNAEWYRGFIEGQAAEYDYGVYPILKKCLGFETKVDFKDTQTELTIMYWPDPSDGDFVVEHKIVVLPKEMNEVESLRLSIQALLRLIEIDIIKCTSC